MSITVNGKNLVVQFTPGQYLGKAYPDGTANPAGATDPTEIVNGFYIAGEAGDYILFDPPVGGLLGAVVGDVLQWDGAAWTNLGINGGTVVACSTTCTMTLNQEFVDVTCKDAGAWINKVASTKSWEITTDALYQDTDAAGTSGFVDLSQLIVQGPNSVAIAFEEINNPHYTTNGNTWSGAAVLPTASLTGDDNSPATYSASFMGNGQLYFTPGV